MSCHLSGPMCSTPGCKRPQRELGQVCTRCWLALTPRERSLLEYLLRRQGEVVSKREVLAHVWDYDFEGDPNIVEVYVRRLRRKIDEPFGRHDLETVRGAGYRLASSGTVETLR